MLELFQTDRMCFEDISDIFAKSDAVKIIVEANNLEFNIRNLKILKRSAKS